MTEEALFELALNALVTDRPALLDRECAGDPMLHARIEARLNTRERLETGTRGDSEPLLPGLTGDATAPSTSALPQVARLAERAGSVIAGKYTLVEEIGEGGMGSVFRAQQAAPVKRQVAVKVIKAGMDSKAVLARFDAERQALALMDHPNIARVLDAGTTDSGRPFFVMELVEGTPITAFCDEHKLAPRQRLELFVSVCQAIQHAHHKGIIHRDIKPSNVLVGLYDGRPVPKVIDFGIAKATQGPLTDHSQVTGFGAVVGTPEYMSPDQASLDSVDIDTRSDVYALGVLLYELLTGTTPVDRKSLGRAAVLEVLRVVRDVEAPRPSTRLSAHEALPRIAANRSVEPARLTGLLRSELDWVVMKALEQDRSQRYETADALARDVERYLADEVVEARPPSAGYRLRKFVRRHKCQVIAAGLVLLALLAGIVGTTWGYVRAEHASARALRRLEQIQRGNSVLTAIFSDLDLRQVKRGETTLEAVLAKRLVTAAGLLEEDSLGDPLAVAQLQDRLGQSLLSLGFAADAIRVFNKAHATRAARLGPGDPATLTSLSNLAAAYHLAGKLELALPLPEEALRLTTARREPEDPETLTCMNNLAADSMATGPAGRCRLSVGAGPSASRPTRRQAAPPPQRP